MSTEPTKAGGGYVQATTADGTAALVADTAPEIWPDADAEAEPG
jgi:hypothetical protein